ncbi:MMPL family transporter [Streptomyces noursei]|uniref:MMPL family transporter n=1 Tax=Streptomyces noursei TaxID=1971 RepID=UPI0030F093D1
MFTRLGAAVTRRAWWFVATPLLLAALIAAVGLTTPATFSHGGFFPSGAESSRAATAVRDTIGRGTADVLVIYRNPTLTVADPAFRRGVEHSLATAPPGTVTASLTYWTSDIPTMVSTDRHAAIAAVMLAGADDNQRARSLHRLRDGLRADGFQLAYAGPTPVIEEVVQRSLAQGARSELIAFPVVFLLLLLLFRSLVAALLPVLIGGLSASLTLLGLRMATHTTGISVLALNLVLAVGLALGVDASLLLVARFRAVLDQHGDVPYAVATTVASAGRTVFCSGLAMCGIAVGFLFFPLAMLRSVGLGAVLVIGISTTLAVTLLPALLALLGYRINALRLPWPRRRRPPVDGWAQIARMVMAHPLRYLIGVSTCLLLLAAPFTHSNFAFPDHHELPEHAPARTATDALRTDFNFNGLDTIQVVVTFANPIDTAQSEQALYAYTRRLTAAPGVQGAMVAARAHTAAVIYLAHGGGAEDSASRDLVHRIRTLPPPQGGQRLVGGLSAMATDTLDTISRRLPWALTYIALYIFTVLLITLRSLLLPLKALVLNALSLTASFGTLTWMFQDGHLAWLAGATRTGYVDVNVPVSLLLVLIALSMDYELFLLCSIREEYDAHGDNTTAVATGLQRTGPVITAAALVVILVSAIFATNDVIVAKQVCVGMLLAMLIDATAIRALLVPAIMRLLGRANWWYPHPPRRLHV